MSRVPIPIPAPSVRSSLIAAILLAGCFGSTPARADVTGIQTLLVKDNPAGLVAMAPWMTNSGWDIRQLNVTYDPKTDTLNVDLKFRGIAGDADGNGNPGTADPRTTLAGGVDLPHLGGRKSISVAFAGIDSNGTRGQALAIAGVPMDKSSYASSAGLNGFRLASYIPGSYGLAVSYGAPLAGPATGQLLYDPSAANPDFEFKIFHFSKIPGADLTKGFYISAFAGSPDDVVAGEASIGWTRVGSFTPAPQVPEPGSVALLGLGGLGFWLGRRPRRAPGDRGPSA